MEIKCHKIKTKETYYGIKGAKIIKSDKNILKKAAKISIPLNEPECRWDGRIQDDKIE